MWFLSPIFHLIYIRRLQMSCSLSFQDHKGHILHWLRCHTKNILTMVDKVIQMYT